MMLSILMGIREKLVDWSLDVPLDIADEMQQLGDRIEGFVAKHVPEDTDPYEDPAPIGLEDDAEALASAGMGTDEDYGSWE